MSMCRYTVFSRFLGSLDKPEAILTFSIGALLNYLRTDGSGLDGLRQFGVSEEFVATWQSLKEDENFGRATAQRTVMETLRFGSGAHFFTPFMMFSKTDNIWMLLAHLSKHQAARDKMLSVHWDKQNHFRHIGKGSLFELGFDHRLIESNNSLFSFRKDDETKMIRELENKLPSKVVDNMIDDALTVEQLLSEIGNLTAAQNDMIFKVLQKMAAEGEIEVAKKTEARRNRVPWLKSQIRSFGQARERSFPSFSSRAKPIMTSVPRSEKSFSANSMVLMWEVPMPHLNYGTGLVQLKQLRYRTSAQGVLSMQLQSNVYPANSIYLALGIATQ